MSRKRNTKLSELEDRNILTKLLKLIPAPILAKYCGYGYPSIYRMAKGSRSITERQELLFKSAVRNYIKDLEELINEDE